MSEVATDTAVHVPGYVIGERLGAGGFGQVFRARHELMGRDVAIKVLHAKYCADPAMIARFVLEARAVGRISHPSIVHVFDFGELADGRQYFVMELVRGTTLRDLLRERTRLPLTEAIPILRAIAEAVDAAHGAGVAHRDLKPDNVFVVDGRVKLIDFGLAKLATDEAPVTETGTVFGTPIYMSPEQCRGKAADLRTDAYSFGVIAYHVLTGEPPFSGDALEIALHHLNDQPDPPSKRCSELSSRVDRVVLSLLAKTPADRPVPLVSAIDAIVGDAPLPRVSRRAWWTRGLLTGGGLTIAVAALALARRSGEPTVENDCALASERLADVWDLEIRSAAQARFAAVDRVDVGATWRRLSVDLDAYAERWTMLWDSSCKTTERKTDPLLHAQRQSCLESARLQLRGVTKSLATVDDAGGYARGVGMGFVANITASLEDCTRTELLREQRPPPSPDVHERATQLAVDSGAARAEVRGAVHGGDYSRFDHGLEQLRVVADRLEAIGLFGAAEASIRTGYLVSAVASGDRTRIDAARAAIADTIRRAESAHLDAIVAGAYSERGRLELALGGDTKVLAEAAERGDAALRRAGRPGGLAFLRAELEVRAGRLEAAIQLLRGELARPVRWLQTAVPSSQWGYADVTRARLIDLLSRLGRHTEALDEARALLASSIADFGQMHQNTSYHHQNVEHALARAGRWNDALAEVDRQLAILVAIRGQPHAIQRVHVRRMAYAFQLGRQAVVDDARVAVLRLGSTQKTIIELAMGAGHIELARAELVRAVAPPALDAALAILAFLNGDLASMRTHAAQIPERPPETGSDLDRWLLGWAHKPWLEAIADAEAGRHVQARARLARLVKPSSDDPTVAAEHHLRTGWVFVALADWPEARTAFERARIAQVWSRNSALAEVDAWLGLARLEAGDARAALEPLDEALDILMTSSARGADCCDGFHYFAPMAEFALARALWATDGDRQRARLVAEQARDHFARIGAPRESERQRVIRWLAERR